MYAHADNMLNSMSVSVPRSLIEQFSRFADRFRNQREARQRDLTKQLQIAAISAGWPILVGQALSVVIAEDGTVTVDWPPVLNDAVKNLELGDEDGHAIPVIHRFLNRVSKLRELQMDWRHWESA